MNTSLFRCVRVAVMAVGVLMALPLIAQIGKQPPEVARITEPIGDGKLVTLNGNVHPLAISRFDQGAAPDDMKTGRIMLVLRSSKAQRQSLTEYLSGLQNRTSPNYHKWLTPAEYGAMFGLPDSDLRAVTGWLESYGFRIEKVPQARNVVEFSGTVGQIQNAFHTRIHCFVVAGQRHYANVSDPKIPEALAPVVAGIATLNDFRPVPQAQFGGTGRYSPASHTILPDLTLFEQNGTPLLFVDPADAATIYDTPNAALNPNYSGTTYDGSGVSIGIAGDSNVTMQDIINYRVAFLGETAATANVPTVVVDGNDPQINGDEVEALLDNEVAGGIAPKAKLYLYTSDNTDLQSGLFNAIFRALDDNTVSILNVSFGGCEAALGSAGNGLLLEGEEQAAAQGISVTVAAGDSGSAGCDSSGEAQAQNGLAVSGFASTPYAIAVGGTDFDILQAQFATYVSDTSDGAAPYFRTALSYIPEQPWNDSTYPNTDVASNVALTSNELTNIIAGGGGSSAVYAKPAFQTSLTPGDSARDVPDVAFLAGNGLYRALWVLCADNVALGAQGSFTDCQMTNGQFTSGSTFTGVGGTSAAAPTFAGMLALIEQKTGSRLGQADYVLYQLAASQYGTVFHDVTTGDNSVVCAPGSENCGSNGFMTGYNADTGYDLASGLGSVDAVQLLANWQSVSLGPTSTSFSINGTTAALNVTHGTSLTLNVGVTPSSASGTVGIVDTANEAASGPQNNGQFAIPLGAGGGSAVYNGLPGGTYTVYARYSGDSSDAASTSTPAINVTVLPETSTTALTVNAYGVTGSNVPISNLSQVPYGSYIFADAQIFGTAEGKAGTQGLATGTVEFSDGGTILASNVAVSSINQASYATPSNAFPTVFPVGSHSVIAAYSGDPSYNASNSQAVAFTVVKGSTSIVFYVTQSSIDSGASTTLYVYINTSSIGAIPTGTITLSANGITLASITNLAPWSYNGAAASVGVATIPGKLLPTGANTITATYSGDQNYFESIGTTIVTVAQSGFSLNNGGALTFAAGATSGNTTSISVAPINGFTGVVDLTCAVTTTPASPVSPATCSIPASLAINGNAPAATNLTITSTASTTSGAYAVTVTGTDAATGTISAVTTVKVTITPTPGAGAPSLSLSNSGPITVSPGASTGNTSTVTVTPANGFTGTVNLSCNIPVAAGSATMNPACSIPASVSITGTTAASTTLTISTTAGSSALNGSLNRFWPPAGEAALALVLLFGIPTRRRQLRRFLGLMILVLSLSAIGCGGSGSSPVGSSSGGTTAGTYSGTVSASDAATGKITATTAVNVTVN
jgi:trimeric autotransporter adhesin